jgi:hypothetical protein
MKLGTAFFGSLLLVAPVSFSSLAVADDPKPPALKPVIFSGPAPQKESPLDQPGSIQFDDPFRAPLSLGKNSPGDSSPLPPPPVNNRRPADKKDWILMTPEEILGVKTPEQILGVDANSSLKSPEERFLDRQHQAELGNTNGGGAGLFNDSLRWSSVKEGKMGGPASELPDGSFQNLNRILSADRPGSGLFPPSQSGSGWTPSAQLQPLDAVQVAKHKADMDGFRELLGEETGKKVVPAPIDYNDPEASRNRQNGATQPLFANPFAAAAKPLSSTEARPAAPAPLTEWAIPKKKVEIPSWTPKPPPWLSQDPNAPMQRKF